MNVNAKLSQIENINGNTQNYLTLEFNHGNKVHISIGDKNYQRLGELMKDETKSATNTQPNEDAQPKGARK
jgi:hypothetical protein